MTGVSGGLVTIRKTPVCVWEEVEIMGLLQKLLQRKLQKEKQKYLRLEHQRAKLEGKISVEKKNSEAVGQTEQD